jgi:hypothetical protein
MRWRTCVLPRSPSPSSGSDTALWTVPDRSVRTGDDKRLWPVAWAAARLATLVASTAVVASSAGTSAASTARTGLVGLGGVGRWRV